MDCCFSFLNEADFIFKSLLRKLRIHLIKETFSMFLGHYSFKTGKVTTSFLGIKNWKDKAVGEIVEIVIHKCFQAKKTKLDKIFFKFL